MRLQRLLPTLGWLLAAALGLGLLWGPTEQKRTVSAVAAARSQPLRGAGDERPGAAGGPRPRPGRLEQRLLRAETRLYLTQIRWARREWQHGCAAEALEVLEECPQDLRHWEHAYLRRLCEGRMRVLGDAFGGVQGLAFSPDGKRLAGAGYDKVVRVWDVTTGDLVLRLRGHRAPVWNVAFSPDGKRLASTSEGGFDEEKPGAIKIWDAATGKEQLTLKGRPGQVTVVDFSPDGRSLASGGGIAQDPPLPGILTVWDLTTGKEAFSLQGHGNTVRGVAFSPDGKRLASAAGGVFDRDQPGEIKVWDLATRRPVRTLRGHAGAVTGEQKARAQQQGGRARV